MSRFLNALRVLVGGREVETIGGVGPERPIASAGQRVNDSSIMQLSAVMACVRLISQSISTLPLGVYRVDGAYPVRDLKHSLNSILSFETSPGVTPSMFWEAMTSSALLQGAGYAEEMRVGERLVGLEFLPYQRLSLVRNDSGTLVYRYTQPEGGTRDIPRNRMFKLTGFTLDGINGVSAIQYGASIFGAALAANEAAANTFQNGLMPTTAFTFPHVVPADQRANFKTMVRQQAGAMRAGEPVVLEGGMTATQIGINPEDAQLLESRQYSIDEICRWFGVPPDLIGHTAGTSAWGTGIEQRTLGFSTFTLRPWVRRIEEAAALKLLPVAERGRFSLKYDMDDLLRADLAARASYQSTMVNNGLRTRDELRVKDGMSPMGGNAAVLTIQSAMMPIDQLGQQGNQI